MQGSSDQNPQSSASVPTPRATPAPESAPRDTQPTGALPHSTLPPEEPSSSSVSDTALSQPASEVRSTPSDSEHGTLHSASHPGSSPGTHWDERRIVHLEHEFDQLSARSRLLDKRIDEVYVRLRWLLGIALLALLAGLWLAARG
jgi:hypothetical protein